MIGWVIGCGLLVYTASLALAYELGFNTWTRTTAASMVRSTEPEVIELRRTTLYSSWSYSWPVFGLSATAIAVAWYRLGWVASIVAVVALYFGAALHGQLIPIYRSDGHYRGVVVRSFMKRYANYVKTGDLVRAKATALVLDDLGYPIPDELRSNGA